LVNLPNETDPSDLGFEKIKNIIDNTCELTETQLMQEKILCRI